MEGTDDDGEYWYSNQQRLGFYIQGDGLCRIYVPLGESYATLDKARAVWIKNHLERFIND